MYVFIGLLLTRTAKAATWSQTNSTIVGCYTHAGGSVAEVGGAADGIRPRGFDEALTHCQVHALTERRAWGIKQSKSNHRHVYSPVGRIQSNII